jgi:hypothetical protein
MKIKCGGKVDDTFRPESVYQTVSSALEIATPELDLIPVPVFTKKYGQSPQALKLPLSSIARANGEELTGVLVYAMWFNPPPGCFRIRSKDVFSIKRATTLANSDTSLWKSEVGDQFLNNLADLEPVSDAPRDRKGQAVDVGGGVLGAFYDDNMIFYSVSALDTMVIRNATVA